MADYVHTPGDILLHEFMEHLGISEEQLAEAIDQPVFLIHDIVHYDWPIDGDMAWRLSKALGTTPEFWATLQAVYMVKRKEPRGLDEVKCLVPEEEKRDD